MAGLTGSAQSLRASHRHEEMSICSFNDLSTLEIETAVIKRECVDVDKPQSNTVCEKIKDFLRLVPRGASRPNYTVFTMIFFSMLSSAFSITFLFPFLPEMIVDFGYSEEEKGYYVGLVASAMFAGRAVGSYFWGWLCDKIGRKPVLIFCTSTCALSTATFGFSTNIKYAIGLRFVTGLLNGTIVVAKVILYEVCDSSNQALGMSMLTVAFGVGIVIGPAAGGLLANPVKKYPGLFGESEFFKSYPYFLPGLIPLVVSIVTVLITFFKLPETKGMYERKKEDSSHKEAQKERDERTQLKNGKGITQPDQNGEENGPSADCVERQPMICSLSSEQDEQLMRSRLNSLSMYQSTLSFHRGQSHNDEKSEKKEKKKCCSDFCALLQDRMVVLSVFIYTLFSFGVIGFEDLFTIWASTKPYLGGLGFSSSQIGIAVGVVSIPMMILQLWIFPKLEARFGCLKTFQGCAIFSMVLVQLTVLLRLLYKDSEALWVCLIVLMVPIRIFGICCMSASSVIINNSVPPALSGAVNGLAMTATAVGRSIAPTAAGSLFAWSIVDGEAIGPPFDVSFPFFMLGLCFFICVIFNLLLPTSLNVQAKKRIEEQLSVNSEPLLETKRTEQRSSNGIDVLSPNHLTMNQNSISTSPRQV